jgi:hypothetical protein
MREPDATEDDLQQPEPDETEPEETGFNDVSDDPDAEIADDQVPEVDR